jgi:hypothetical protein
MSSKLCILGCTKSGNVPGGQPIKAVLVKVLANFERGILGGGNKSESLQCRGASAGLFDLTRRLTNRRNIPELACFAQGIYT